MDLSRVGLVFTFSEDENFCNSDVVNGSNEWDPVDATKLVHNVRHAKTDI